MCHTPCYNQIFFESCLPHVSFGYIMYLMGTLSSIKKPAEAGSYILIRPLLCIFLVFPRKSLYQL
ncbi:hypothetical protein F7720_05210 [Shigella sonnei]|uniref:Uncharacterized protein n=1 Tax=Escherichia coli TaxID=562 RepID=A0A8S7LC52_ECOLX|nr:hypothetical protein [Shigella sonnei]EEV6139322.1 hypothetical protein [Escherichia coli]EFY5195314.1 hypothetical protein [Shigella flexneri]TVM38540.1 hypothetical protein FPV20_22050 [Escherichia coli O177]EEV6982805.1 hypothetical protein [Escherichia coli]